MIACHSLLDHVPMVVLSKREDVIPNLNNPVPDIAGLSMKIMCIIIIPSLYH